MPPFQETKAVDAIGKMRDALAEVKQDALDLYNSKEFKKGQKDAKENYKKLRKKYYNLKAVIEALKGAEIKYGVPDGEEYASANRSTNPPKIKVNMTWLAVREAVLAQILAHEAVHLLTKTKGNSIDQEIRCRKKELEVWSLLKGDENHILDFVCNNEQDMFAKGEDYVRQRLRQIYKGVPEHDVKKTKKKKKKKTKKRGRIKISKSKNFLSDTWYIFSDFFKGLFQLLFLRVMSDMEYSFYVKFPKNYITYETEGHDSIFYGIIGVNENEENSNFPTAITVFEKPDVLHGGDWDKFESEVEYQLDVIKGFNSDVFDQRLKILKNESQSLAGNDAHCLEIEYDIVLHDATPDNWRSRIRERTIYTQKNEFIYSLSLSAIVSKWEDRAIEFDNFVESFFIRG